MSYAIVRANGKAEVVGEFPPLSSALGLHERISFIDTFHGLKKLERDYYISNASGNATLKPRDNGSLTFSLEIVASSPSALEELKRRALEIAGVTDSENKM